MFRLVFFFITFNDSWVMCYVDQQLPPPSNIGVLLDVEGNSVPIESDEGEKPIEDTGPGILMASYLIISTQMP